MTDPAAPTRRQVLLTSGAVVAAAAVTAACGSSGGSGSGAQGDSVPTADVPVGGGVILGGAQAVVTQPQSGTFKAFSAICTHQGCLVSAVADGTIDCACHGSRFSITDGSVVAGPAPSPLAPRTATVSGGTVTVT